MYNTCIQVYAITCTLMYSFFIMCLCIVCMVPYIPIIFCSINILLIPIQYMPVVYSYVFVYAIVTWFRGFYLCHVQMSLYPQGYCLPLTHTYCASSNDIMMISNNVLLTLCDFNNDIVFIPTFYIHIYIHRTF